MRNRKLPFDRRTLAGGVADVPSGRFFQGYQWPTTIVDQWSPLNDDMVARSSAHGVPLSVAKEKCCFRIFVSRRSSIYNHYMLRNAVDGLSLSWSLGGPLVLQRKASPALPCSRSISWGCKSHCIQQKQLFSKDVNAISGWL